MKPPHARKPRPVPPGGQFTDRQTARSLGSGSGYLHPEAAHEQRRFGQLPWVKEFWKNHAPELVDFDLRASDDEDVAYAEIRRWRKRQHDRARYLLLHDLLAGEALESIQKLKRQHERYEWRKPQ